MDVPNYNILESILREAYMTMSYADMVIDCCDGSVPIHRHVLAAASPFLTPLLRDYNPIESHRILIPDIKMSTMKHVLSILYTGQTFTPLRTEFDEIVEAIQLLGIDFNCDPSEGGKKWDVSEVIVVIQPQDQDQAESLSISHSASTENSVKENDDVQLHNFPYVDEGDVFVESEVEIDKDGKNLSTLNHEVLPDPVINLEEGCQYVAPLSIQRQSNTLKVRKGEEIIKRQIKNQNFIARKPKPKSIHVTTSETAQVIQSMLESGQLCLAPGPALGKRTTSQFVKKPSTFSRKPPNNKHKTLNLNASTFDYDEPIMILEDDHSRSSSGREECDEGFDAGSGTTETTEEIEDDYTMTEEEILDAAKISSQKDHAYAHSFSKPKRIRSTTELLLQKKPSTHQNGEHVYTIIT